MTGDDRQRCAHCANRQPGWVTAVVVVTEAVCVLGTLALFGFLMWTVNR